MEYTHVLKVTTGQVFGFQPQLAQMPNFRPVNLNPDGSPIDVVTPQVPRKHAADMQAALDRLEQLEFQMADVMRIIKNIPNGEDMLKSRVEAKEVQQSLSSAPPPPTKTNMAPPVPATNHDANEVSKLQLEIDDATENLVQKEAYLVERTEIRDTAQRNLSDAERDLANAVDEGDKVRLSAEIVDKTGVLKNATTKFRSATTKHENGQRRLADAEQAMNEYLAQAQ